MTAWGHSLVKHATCRGSRLAAVACGLLLAGQVSAAAILIRDAHIQLDSNGVYTMNVDASFDLGSEALEALANGIPLSFEITTRVQEARDWLWDRTLTSRKRRLQIQYHALSEQYVVKNLTHNAQESYLTRDSAVAALGRLEKLWLIDKAALEAGTDYRVRLRIALDDNALPSPMRPWAWFSADWQLDSEWHAWPLP